MADKVSISIDGNAFESGLVGTYVKQPDCLYLLPVYKHTNADFYIHFAMLVLVSLFFCRAYAGSIFFVNCV